MKYCNKCKLEKEESNFRPNRKRLDGLQVYCIECDKEYQKEWYKINKEKCIKKALVRNKLNKDINTNFIISYLSSHPCSICGEKDILVLQFDHISNKTFAISSLINSYKLHMLEKEIEKCQVLCANCHTRKTAKQFNWYRLKI